MNYKFSLGYIILLFVIVSSNPKPSPRTVVISNSGTVRSYLNSFYIFIFICIFFPIFRAAGDVNVSEENGHVEIVINGYRVIERCVKPLPQDLASALREFYSSVDNVTSRASNWYADDDIVDTSFVDTRFPFNFPFAAIGARIKAHLARMHNRIAQVEAAKTRFAKRIQDKVGPHLNIQSIVVVDDCIFVNGTVIDKFLVR